MITTAATPLVPPIDGVADLPVLTTESVLLGATIMCLSAGELIHEPALALRTGTFTGRLAQAVHAYPTWSIAIEQAAAQFFGASGGRTARPAGRKPGK